MAQVGGGWLRLQPRERQTRLAPLGALHAPRLQYQGVLMRDALFAFALGIAGAVFLFYGLSA